MDRVGRARRMLIGAVSVVGLPSLAQAEFYEMAWSSRYGSGSIVFDASVPDGNPSPLQGDYSGAIASYDLTGWEQLTATRFAGSSGSISIQAREPLGTGGCGGESACTRGAALTFELGSATAGPEGWHLTTSLSWSISPAADGLPTSLPRGEVSGYLMPDVNPTGRSLLAMTPLTESATITLVNPPVPEPGTWALFAAGLGFLGLTARSRRGGDRRAG